MLHANSDRPFPIGKLVITPNALHRLPQHEVVDALHSHTHGDQGDFAEPPNPRKRHPVLDGCRLLSAYRAQDGTRFLVITEADLSRTTVLLPEDC